MRAIYPLALVCATLALANPATAQDKQPIARVAAAKPAKQAAAPSPSMPSPLPTLAAANPEQQLAASQVLYGPYECEFKQTLSIAKHQVDGYAVVTFSSKAYTMKPVRSSTGAVRLEEVGNGPMLMVQIPTKSMLMDTVRGRRIVDACVNEVQAREVSAPDSLGMKMDGQVTTAETAPTPKR